MNMLKTKSGFNLKAKDAGSKRPATFSDTSKKSTRSPKRKRGDAPSEEALALSSRLKELSNRKQLRAALDLFWSKANDSIRDAHHACIIIDCCSRCGDCEEGERVAERLKRSGRKLNVEANTALLKGFAHSGEIAKAMHLFENMCTTKGEIR
jgi:pentatricopeptide repeat protein